MADAAPHASGAATPETGPPAAASTWHVGSPGMPPWNVAELPPAPVFDWGKVFSLIGPSIIAGGAAIGGGEWLMGPAVTARYGGALMWLATVSILCQVVYNIEISRYALFSGEPIMNGKFRTHPGPQFWLWLYAFVDFAAIFPYLAANAASPLFILLLGRAPNSALPDDQWKMRLIGYGVFLLCCLPMVFGGKIYKSLRALMTFKIIVVLGFLSVLAVFYSTRDTWREICGGFLRFGTIPIRQAEDLDGDGQRGAEEGDWDSDGRVDVVEPELVVVAGTPGQPPRGFDVDGDGAVDALVPLAGASADAPAERWPDCDHDGAPDEVVAIVGKKNERLTVRRPDAAGAGPLLVLKTKDGRDESGWVDVDRDGVRDGDAVANVFVWLFSGRGLPPIDLSMIAFLGAFAAIAGNGGLTNVPISNFTRDQGWGMGHHVGAIPSMVGGVNVELSHVGSVFVVNEGSLQRWRGWLRHVRRDQLCVWMPACFVGIALPSMLSLVFLRRGTSADGWTAATMTSQGVYDAVLANFGPGLGGFCWFMTLFCGFLVLGTAMAAMIDGFVRRWVDVFWTGSARLRDLDPSNIRYVYFAVLCAYCVFGLVMLSFSEPTTLVKLATNVMNFALAMSCWHTLYVNHTLLPRPLRPGWFPTATLLAAGVFFFVLAVLAMLKTVGVIA